MKELEGVSRAAVDPAAKSVRVVCDPGKVGPDKIKAAIQDAGYRVAGWEIGAGFKITRCLCRVIYFN